MSASHSLADAAPLSHAAGVASSAFADAAALYRSAVERDPADATAHNNLAVTLCLGGDFATALAHVRRAIQLAPDFVDAYVNGAVIAGNLCGHEAALPWLDAALRRNPDHVSALLLQASSLATLGRSTEALAAFRRAAALRPNDAEIYEMAAAVLHADRRYDEALTAYGRAQSLSSDGMIVVRKAMLLLERGDDRAASGALRDVLAAHPRLVPAWYALALARDFELDDDEVAALEQVARSAADLTFGDRVQLAFTLGRAHLARGADRIAFGHLAAANALKRGSLRYDVGTDERMMLELAAGIGSAEERNGDASELPVFVVGMPRSGTTLVEQIIASHPLAFGAGELADITLLAQPRITLAQPSPSELGREYVDRVAQLAPGAVRVVDKMPLNFLHLGTIRRILPRARIIHCRRNPVDTCLSCYITLFDKPLHFSYDQAELGRFYRAYDALMSAWRRAMPPDRFLEVDYEEVVDDLEGQARRLIAFCGLPWDDRCLRFYQSARAVRSASMTQVRRPIYRTSVGRARRYAPHLRTLLSTLDGGAGPMKGDAVPLV